MDVPDLRDFLHGRIFRPRTMLMMGTRLIGEIIHQKKQFREIVIIVMWDGLRLQTTEISEVEHGSRNSSEQGNEGSSNTLEGPAVRLLFKDSMINTGVFNATLQIDVFFNEDGTTQSIYHIISKRFQMFRVGVPCVNRLLDKSPSLDLQTGAPYSYMSVGLFPI